MFKKIVIVIIILSLGQIVYAVRPATVEDNYIIKKDFEIELGYDTNPRDNVEHDIGFALNAKLDPKWEFGIAKTYKHTQHHDWGQYDAVVKTKYSFSDNWGFQFTFSGIEGDEKNYFGDDFIKYGFTLLNTTSLNEKYETDWNVNYTTYDRVWLWPNDIQNNWNVGLTLKYNVSNELQFMAQATKLIVRTYIDNNTDNHVIYRGGLSYSGWKWPVDAAIYSLPAKGDAYGFTAGATIPFEF